VEEFMSVEDVAKLNDVLTAIDEAEREHSHGPA
jgi:hypothetical protein